MIYKHPNYKNGYIFAPSSNDLDLQKIYETDYNGYDNVKCIICNNKTKKNFRISDSLGFAHEDQFISIITINNHIADGCFFINHLF